MSFFESFVQPFCPQAYKQTLELLAEEAISSHKLEHARIFLEAAVIANLPWSGAEDQRTKLRAVFKARQDTGDIDERDAWSICSHLLREPTLAD